MKVFSSQCLVVILLLFVSRASSVSVSQQKLTCTKKGGPCYLKSVTCPVECPRVQPTDQNSKGCFLDCYSPKCETICRKRKPDCNGPGAACFDPRFIGGDGIVFYFHGRSNEHFSLVSDPNIQINARFIGHRPEGRTRDYTWIQALGVMFNSHSFSLEAKTVQKWNDEVDQLQFSYDGKTLIVPEGHLSEWKSPEEDLRVERTSSKNSVRVIIAGFAEISINVVPVTEQDDKIHSYKIPSNDCFAHLEVQFRFFALSPDVEGVLGRTYRPDYKNPAKPGVAMPVVGGEDKYRTKSLLSSDCSSCIFSPDGVVAKESTLVMDYGTLDCSHGVSGGNGIVCKK